MKLIGIPAVKKFETEGRLYLENLNAIYKPVSKIKY